MRRIFTHDRRNGTAAMETAFLLPVVLIGLMMLFEIARLALVLIVGNLALESSMQGLRRETTIALTDDGLVAERVKAGMVDASYGYLQASEITVRVTSYADLATFGSALAQNEAAQAEEDTTSAKYPVLSVEVILTQDWISALPALLGLADSFTYTYRHLLGNLYQPAATS